MVTARGGGGRKKAGGEGKIPDMCMLLFLREVPEWSGLSSSPPCENGMVSDRSRPAKVPEREACQL